jgi:aerobic carbon-monoxide dehydrogenase large subunit
MGGRFFGREHKRLEDAALLSGRGTYLDDMSLPGQLWVTFVRSDEAHVDFDLDVSAALNVDGVVDVITAADLDEVPVVPVMVPDDGHLPCSEPVLAVGTARYVGQPLAAIVSESRYAGEDAIAEVVVETRRRPVVASIARAIEPNAPVLMDGVPGNIAGVFTHQVGDPASAFAAADVVVEGTFDSHRYSGLPLEPRGVIASLNRRGNTLTLWSSTQWPHTVRDALVKVLPFAEHQIRVVAPDVGGGFGVKQEVYPEEIALAILTMRLGRPVKWVETRSEHFVAANHAREQRLSVRVGARKDGTVIAMSAEIHSDQGAYVRSLGLLGPSLTPCELTGPYAIKNYEVTSYSVLTNKTPIGVYRGAGLPEAVFATERAMDRLAERLDIDPAEIRRRNLIGKDAFPYDTGLEQGGIPFLYESGDYGAVLDRVLEISDYEGWRARQSHARNEGRLIGVGVATFVMLGAFGPFESARVRMDTTGEVLVITGTSPHGQGTATAIAQIVADVLGIVPEQVTVRHGDTDLIPHGVGTFASRGGVLGGSAAHGAARLVSEKALAVAAQRLEASSGDLEVVEGGVAVVGAPDRFLAWADVAAAAQPGMPMPDGVEPVLEATHYFEAPLCTFSGGAHVAVVEISPRTGEIEILDYATVTDAGTIINPMIARAQIAGGLAQGLGGALLEELRYDAEGQLVTGSFADYLVPRATDMPDVKIEFIETPSPYNPLGAKGLGESGTVGAPAAICNAVEDAVRHLGIHVDGTPLTPDRIWEMIDDATSKEAASQS